MTIPHDAVKDKIFKEIASILFLHDEAHQETRNEHLVFVCECGGYAVLEDESQFKSTMARHQSDMLADEVKKIAATAWDEGWCLGVEKDEPAMAGIFINPYRDFLVNFDPKRTTV